MSPERTACAHCGAFLRADYVNRRTLTTLAGVTRLRLTIRRCRNESCAAVRRPYRPEAEGRLALPHHEFGLDVIALVGHLRSREHRSVPEIRAHLVGRGVRIAERTVTNLLDRYDELLAVALTDDTRLRTVLADQKRVILAIDGLRPDVGHEALWVVGDCLSGAILLARSLLSATRADLATLLTRVKSACPVPVPGVVSDGRHTIRQAVAAVFPGCRTDCASSTTGARPPARSARRTGTPRRSWRRRSAGCGGSRGRWKAAPTRTRRWFAGPVRPSAARGPTTGVRRWRRRG